MIITRTEAIILSSFIKMMQLDAAELKHLTESALAEFQKEVEKEEQKNKYVRKYIEYKFSRYRNEYLRIFLHNNLHFYFDIKGAEPKLHKCPCCGYYTLEKISEYFICAVCFWEDDGSLGTNYSSVNRMTMEQAKINFSIFKAVNEGSLTSLDKDRFLQFSI
jgi:hypothetical protein